MKYKLFAVIICTELFTVTLALLISIFGNSVGIKLPEPTGLILIFLLPIIFGSHVFEEFIFPGKFEEWYKNYHPEFANTTMSAYFFKINAIPLASSTFLTLGVFNYSGNFSFIGIRAWFAFLSILFVNMFFHIRGTLRLKKYSPGLITALVLYFPFTIFSSVYFLKTNTMDVLSVIVCFMVGLLFQPLVDHIKNQY